MNYHQIRQLVSVDSPNMQPRHHGWTGHLGPVKAPGSVDHFEQKTAKSQIHLCRETSHHGCSTLLRTTTVPLVVPPPRIPVANEGLGWDPLLKIKNLVVTIASWAGGQPNGYPFLLDNFFFPGVHWAFFTFIGRQGPYMEHSLWCSSPSAWLEAG